MTGDLRVAVGPKLKTKMTRFLNAEDLVAVICSLRQMMMVYRLNLR